MHPVLWVPLLAGLLWLVWVGATGRHQTAVRMVGAAIAGLVVVAGGIALVSDSTRPDGFPSIAVMGGLIAVGGLVGLVGIGIWQGWSALVLRWVGLFFVLVAPMVFFGTGLLSVAAAFFYAPCLQPAADT